MQTNSPDQALVAYRKLVAINPESLDGQIRYGQAQLVTGHGDGAYATFQAALKTKPDAYAAQNVAIASLIRQGHLDEAGKLIADVKQQSPKSPILPELDADLKLARHQYPDAATSYRKLLAQAPTSSLLIKTYSAVALSGNTIEANTLLADWLKAHPKDLSVQLYQAELAVRSRDYARASQAYRVVLEQQPNNAAVLNNLAWSLWQQKDPKAIGYAEKALTLAPTSPDVGDTLGWMLVEQGDVKRGLDLLQRASAAAPQQRSITLHLAKALLKDGRKDDARTKLQDIADAAPDSAEGKESQALMSSL
jgi:putative PEP-CTERM system TPR-repeat lipoprotein